MLRPSSLGMLSFSASFTLSLNSSRLPNPASIKVSNFCFSSIR